VYLLLKGTHYEAGYNRVVVPIPIHIWEVIRKQGAADLSLAGKSDAELQALAVANVDKRLAEYERHKRSGGPGAYLFRSVEEPREQQVAQELERCRQMRREQEEIQAAIAETEERNARKVWPFAKQDSEASQG
jgi:hypothetical protein